MNSRTLRAPLAALPLAVLASLSHAQTPSAGTLSEVVVTATRNSQLLSATLAHTTVISRDDIERSQANDLVTLLQREAGLQPTQNGGVGTVSSVFMRGAPSLQTLVLLDGVPLNKQDASGAVSLEHLMLDNIERVEVVRGNVSAIYGSGAIGGVIQIFTREGSRKTNGSVALEIGPRDTAKVSAQASGRVGSTSISAGVSRYVSDGFSSIDPAQYPIANPDADGYRNTSVNLALTHELAPRHLVGARIVRSSGDTDYDSAFASAPTDIHRSTTRLQQVSLYSDNTWGDWRSRVTFSEQSDRSKTSDDGEWGSIDRYRTQATVLTWLNNLALGDDWLLTGGVEHQWQKVATASDVYDAYSTSRQTTAVFGGVEGAVGPGQFQLNLRHDKVGELTENTGLVGYSLPLSDAFKLFTSVSTAFNAPPLGYLYNPSFGNPALKPEQARSREVALQYASGEHLLRTTWFHTRVNNQLNYNPSISRFGNIGRTQNQGVEVSYRGKWRNTGLRASFTAQDPRDEDSGDTLQRRARAMWSVGMSHPFGALLVDADLRHSGRRQDSSKTLASYRVLDMAASYQLRNGVQLRGRIDNVSNANYQTVYGYNQQPRSLYVGVTWRPSF